MVTSKSRRFICACQFVDPKLNSSVSMQNYSLNIVYYSHWSHFCSLFSPWIMLLTLMKLKSSGSVVKKPHASAWDRIRSLGREDPLEEEMATHSRILAWEIPWAEEPGGLQSKGSQRVGHDWAIEHPHTHSYTKLHSWVCSFQQLTRNELQVSFFVLNFFAW